VKSKDEFTDALNITIPLTKSSESVASLQSVINSYFSAIGAGRKL
jgi:hypothetical protein